MQLISSSTQHLTEVMTWFSDAEPSTKSNGSNYKYPVIHETFLDDVKLNELVSYSLIDDDGSLKAFGQYYLRQGCCHLGRIVVAPSERGKGIGKLLIKLLMEQGCTELGVETCALFVLKSNSPATETYQRLGFSIHPYSGNIPTEDCEYMTKNLEIEE
jgi:ribosomal protein S18 acetylase RimI-like enzyme